MAPIVKKRWKDVNKERKAIRKQWKEKKLCKQLGLKDFKVENEGNLNESGDKCVDTTDEQQQIVDTSHCKMLRTLSIAVPGSILENAQSFELRTYLAGQIARAACIYNVEEIIVFNDKGEGNDNKMEVLVEKTKNKSCLRLARILQYLECPQYLRKYIFPLHKDLHYAGLLNPLDAPHHLRQQDEFPFREGIVSDVPVRKGCGSYVNIGLLKKIMVDKVLTPNLRVTVKILPSDESSKKLRGIVVSPLQPKLEEDVYWGYSVRLAESLSEVLVNSPYENGYDFCIGTSDKGKSIDEFSNESNKDYKHCLIVFGGLNGLESALECDDKLDCDDISLLFDMYVNTCPNQGSRSIRTEEAILISLAELRHFF